MHHISLIDAPFFCVCVSFSCTPLHPSLHTHTPHMSSTLLAPPYAAMDVRRIQMVYSRAALRVAPITSQLPTPYMSSTLLALLVGSTCSGGCAEDTDGLLTHHLESCSHYRPVTHTHSAYVIHIACAASWLDMQRWMCGGYRWFTHEAP